MDAKKKTSQLYSICSELFGDEFNKMFVAKREDFRDWLNEKTGCKVDHIIDINGAVDAWIEKLEAMSKAG